MKKVKFSILLLISTEVLASPGSFIFGKAIGFIPVPQAQMTHSDSFSTVDDSSDSNDSEANTPSPRRGDTEIIQDPIASYAQEIFRTVIRATSPGLNGISVNQPNSDSGTVEIFLDADPTSNSIRLVPDDNQAHIENRFQLAFNRDSVRYARRIVIHGTLPGRMWDFCPDIFPTNLFFELLNQTPYVEEIEISNVHFTQGTAEDLFRSILRICRLRSLRIINSLDSAELLINKTYSRNETP